MVKDKIELGDIGLRGLVTVELFNSKTGKLENKIKKENFIAIGNKKWWAKLQRDSIISKMPAGIKNQAYGMESFFDSQYFFNRIILTDDASPEQPDTEVLPEGNLIGQVDIRDVATSPHTTAGVLNLNESYIDGEKIHIVGDFGTDRGNGTFQSIGFINCNEGYNTYRDYIQAYYGVTEYLDYKGSGSNYNLTTKMGNKLIYNSCYNYTGYNSQPFYYFDLDNSEAGLQVLFEIDTAITKTGLTHNGEHLFVSLGNYSIREYDLDGNVINTLTTEVPNIYGIYFDIDEDVFYVTSSASASNPINEPWNLCMYKVNKTTGEIMEIIPFIYRNAGYKVCDRFADGSFVFFFNSTSSVSVFIVQDFDRNHYKYFGIFSGPLFSSLAVEGNNLYQIRFNSAENYNVAKVYPTALCSRVLLPSPQTKTNTQTMKVTYDLYYTDWRKV